VDAILRHLHLLQQRHHSHPPAGWPQPHLDLEVEDAVEIHQTPASDPSEPEPVPDLEVGRAMP
jgi:hypothetical protein